jgi:hypothetical protein
MLSDPADFQGPAGRPEVGPAAIAPPVAPRNDPSLWVVLKTRGVGMC